MSQELVLVIIGLVVAAIVLRPLVRTRATALVVLAASGVTPVLALLVPGGVAVLGAGVLGSAVGAWWLRHASQATR